jgi:quinoprotein glucose dehydrogenase
LERGIVRAFDARTGELRWVWDPIPRDPADPAFQTWASGSAQRTGAANVWAQLSVDVARDLVFVPTSSPSPDYYGGKRQGSNSYADSVVALRGSTGELVWHFQIVHHNIWDYDLPAQPSLITIRKDGRDIPALAQPTKMGFLYLLHRETGQPIFPVEERPVPQSDVPGEKAGQHSRSRPFPGHWCQRHSAAITHGVSPPGTRANAGNSSSAIATTASLPPRAWKEPSNTQM